MQTFQVWVTGIVILYVSQTIVNGQERRGGALYIRPEETVDKILKTYKLATISSGNIHGEVNIADIEEDFPLSPFPINGRFLAAGGRLRNMLTVRRTGPAHIERDTENTTIRQSLEFDYLQVSFDRFVINVPLFRNLTGSIDAEIRDCLIEVTVEVKPGNPCTARLFDLKVTGFGDFVPSVHEAYWDILDKISMVIKEEFIDLLSLNVKASLETYFYGNVKDAVEAANVCGDDTEFPSTSPPPDYQPSPPGYQPSPPDYQPSPPDYQPSPQNYQPSPPDYQPSPPNY